MLLLALPLTLLFLAGLLAFTEWAEKELVSSRALIVRVATDRRSRPEHAEALVSRELDRILRHGAQ